MGVFAPLTWLVFFTGCVITYQATIGDGRVSLYTGQPVNSLDLGRGACKANSRLYPSETAIPRDHPCHYCICYQSQVTCYWKQCAAAPRGCAVMHFENVCNPSLYMCKIPVKAKAQPKRVFGDRINTLRRRRLIREAHPTSSLILPIDEAFPVKFDEEFVARIERSVRMRRSINGTDHHSLHHSHDKSCMVLGVKYNLGEVIGVASGVCMECRCAAAKMFCSPKCCFLPSPFEMTSHQTGQLMNRPKDPAGPHPLSYVRNQFEESPILSGTGPIPV